LEVGHHAHVHPERRESDRLGKTMREKRRKTGRARELSAVTAAPDIMEGGHRQWGFACWGAPARGVASRTSYCDWPRACSLSQGTRQPLGERVSAPSKAARQCATRPHPIRTPTACSLDRGRQDPASARGIRRTRRQEYVPANLDAGKITSSLGKIHAWLFCQVNIALQPGSRAQVILADGLRRSQTWLLL